MAATQEAPDGLVDLGRQIADDAAQLVKAEIGLAKARAIEVAKKFAFGAALIAAGLISSLFFLIFTVGTLVEGVYALDSWPLYVAVGGLLVGGGLFVLGSGAPGWLSGLCTFLGGLGVLTFLAGLVGFYVIAIIGANDEFARRGWAIAGATFFTLTIVACAAGGLIVWRGVRGTMHAVSDIKEDAAWVKQLTKRNASES